MKRLDLFNFIRKRQKTISKLQHFVLVYWGLVGGTESTGIFNQNAMQRNDAFKSTTRIENVVRRVCPNLGVFVEVHAGLRGDVLGADYLAVPL